jgi:hypothetical protein
MLDVESGAGATDREAPAPPARWGWVLLRVLSIVLAVSLFAFGALYSLLGALVALTGSDGDGPAVSGWDRVWPLVLGVGLLLAGGLLLFSPTLRRRWKARRRTAR